MLTAGRTPPPGIGTWRGLTAFVEDIGASVRPCREPPETLGLGAVASVSMILHNMGLQGPAWDLDDSGRPAVSCRLAEVYLYGSMR
jgi:hypothetical protein